MVFIHGPYRFPVGGRRDALASSIRDLVRSSAGHAVEIKLHGPGTVRIVEELAAGHGRRRRGVLRHPRRFVKAGVAHGPAFRSLGATSPFAIAPKLCGLASLRENLPARRTGSRDGHASGRLLTARSQLNAGGRVASSPWFADDAPSLRALALIQSPLPFKRRNLFTPSVELPLRLRAGRPVKSLDEKRRTNADRQRRFRKRRQRELAELRSLIPPSVTSWPIRLQTDGDLHPGDDPATHRGACPLPSRRAVANAGKSIRVTDIMNTVEQVEAVIRRLPRKARQQVAERLNAQLWPSGFAPEVETAWADTVKRRLDDLDSGRVQGVPAAQVFARARRVLARQ